MPTGALILWDALGGVYVALGFAAFDDEAFRRGRVDRRASSASTVRAAVLDPARALLAGWRNRWCEQPQTGRFPFFECAGDPSHLLVRGRKVVDRADEWREVASVVVCERPVRLRTLRIFHVDERPQEGGERAGVLRRHYYSKP